eukprot:12138640-Alexandrium_andersonii.AAC.1
MQRATPCLHALPDPQDDMHPWEAMARDHPREWRAHARGLLVLSALGEATQYGHVRGNTRVMQESLLHECDQCSKCFRSAAALLTHRSCMHGYRHPANRWAGSDGICRA